MENKWHCSPEARARQRLQPILRRQKWFEENGPCVMCGSSENLELHHKEKVTKMRKNDHNCWEWSEEMRNAELAKCEALCRNCHRRVVHGRKPFKHGTDFGYVRGCRCDLCKLRQTERMRVYRAKVYAGENRQRWPRIPTEKSSPSPPSQ